MPATAAQLAANRVNATFSSGPRSSEGRAVAARNSTKHGLTSERYAVLPHENSEEFDELLDALRNDLGPVGAVEELLVRQVAEASWRVRRAAEYEAGALIEEGADSSGAGRAAWRDAQSGKGNVVQFAQRYLSAAERSRLSALHELERRQAARRGSQVPVPVAVDVNISGDADSTT